MMFTNFNIVTRDSGSDMDSYLSPYVRDLICTVGSEDVISDKKCYDECFLHDYCVNFNAVITLLPEEPDNPDQQYYKECVVRITPVIAASGCKKLPPSSLQQEYTQLLKWTGQNELLLDVCEMLESDESAVGARLILAVQIIASVIERAIGNLYLLRSMPCPSLLKDLLNSTELADVLGMDTTRVLRILMGPPISLNLRNIVWHGFAGPGELHQRLVYFLVHVIAGIGHVLAEKRLLHVPLRAYAAVDHVKEMTPQLPDLPPFKQLEKIVESTAFIPVLMRPVVLESLRLLEYGKSNYSLVLLLPMVEHSLRCLFARVNQCEHRLLTAESTALYTTLDEMFCASLPDGSENILRKTLGDPIMEMLHDLLVYPEGPRLRDRLSHGEVDVLSEDHVGAQCSWRLAAVLMLKFYGAAECDVTLQVRVVDAANTYRAIYHPISMLRKEILSLSRHLSAFKDFPRPPTNNSLHSGWESSLDDSGRRHINMAALGAEVSSFNMASDGCELLERFVDPLTDVDDVVMKEMRLDVTLIHRECRSDGSAGTIGEAELIGLLRKIVENACNVYENVRVASLVRYEQWSGRQLRSRQRNTYKLQLDSIPVINLGLRVTLYIVVIVIRHIDHWNEVDHSNQFKLIKRLRLALKRCENLVSYTQLERNRWSEAAGLIHDWLRPFNTDA